MSLAGGMSVLPTHGAIAGSREVCMHFCRTGRCKHGSGCKYVHDRTKVALCRSYLRHECDRDSSACDLSHDFDPNRMPECGLFLRNLCVNPNCRYLHIKKAHDAPDCEDFRNSWCPLGVKCPKRHYIPPSTVDKKRARGDDTGDSDREEEDEDELLRRTWEETTTLRMYD